jgi:hypothetical protein
MLEWWKPLAIVLMLPAAFLVITGLITPNPGTVGEEGRLDEPPKASCGLPVIPF